MVKTLYSILHRSLDLTIFLVVEFCYIIIFGLFLKSFKNILLKDFLLKVFPTIFLVSMIIGGILIWCNLF